MLFIYLIIQQASGYVLKESVIPAYIPIVEARDIPEMTATLVGEQLQRESRSMESKIFALRDKEMVDYSKRTIENITKYIQSLKEEKRSTISSPHHRVNHRRDRRIHRQRIKRGRKMSPKPSSTVPIAKTRTQTDN